MGNINPSPHICFFSIAPSHEPVNQFYWQDTLITATVRIQAVVLVKSKEYYGVTDMIGQTEKKLSSTRSEIKQIDVTCWHADNAATAKMQLTLLPFGELVPDS